MLLSRLSVVLFLTAVLSTGCLRSHRTPGKGDASVQETTDFRVSTITGPSIPNSESGVWKVPTSKTYEFKACLIGRNTTAQLPSGHKFVIETPMQVQFNDETDDQGCIYWSETVPFNLTGDSTYIELERKLIGKGTYRGTYNLKIGVNPWGQYNRNDNSLPEVIDLTRNSILAGREMISEVESQRSGQLPAVFRHSNSQNGRPLLIEKSPTLDIQDGRTVVGGRMIKMILTMNPFMAPLNLNNDQSPYKFNTGKFRVYAQIVATGVGEEGNVKNQLLTTNLLPQTTGEAEEGNTVEIREDGTLVFEVDTKLDKYVSSGQYELAIRVEAVDAPFNLIAYQGLHRIGTGELRQIFGRRGITQNKGNYSNERIFNYGEFIADSDNFEELEAAGFARELKAVRFSRLEPRFVRLSSGETATERTLIFQTSVIVTNSITGTPIIDQPFRVKRTFDGEIVNTETDENGYMVWMDEIRHLYYAPIQYFFPKPELTHVESGYTEARELAINPWDEGWTFGKDTRGLEVDFQRAAARTQRKPMFIIDAFRYQTIRFRYVIDEFLTLNVKKAVVMTFDPLVQRFGIQKDRYFEPLRDGIYLMKLALVKYYIDPFKNKTMLKPQDENGNTQSKFELVDTNGEQVEDQFTTVVKKLIRVQGGRITTPVEFSMRDLRMMSIRNNLIVEIATIDENRLMRDNLINEKLNDLEDDYRRYNDPNTTDEEREQILIEKFHMLTIDRVRLRTNLEEEFLRLQRDRSVLSDPYFNDGRFDRHDELQANLENENLSTESLRDGHQDFVNFKSTMMLKKDEFAARIEELRESLSSMQIQMDADLGEWSDAYLESITHPTDENRLIDYYNIAIDDPETLERLEQGALNSEQEVFDQYESEVEAVLAQRALIAAGGGETLPTLPEVPLENRYARISYVDYLASMQTFTSRAANGISLSYSDLQRLKINNYTENPATPLIDLDLYRNDAGLTPRSFIAPCTLVENDNMSDMRPTDTLDEADSGKMDSSELLYEQRFEIDNSIFENSAYHDSLSPFKTDLEEVENSILNLQAGEKPSTLLNRYIDEHIENEKMYEMQMDAISQMGNFTKSYNLEYVSLELDGEKHPLKIFDDGCTFEDNQVCLKDRIQDETPKESFVSSMNKNKDWNNLKRYFYLNPMRVLKNANQRLLDSNNAFITLGEEFSNTANSWLDMIKFRPFYNNNDTGSVTSTNYYKSAKAYKDDHLGGQFRSFETMDAAKWLSGGVDDLRLVDAIRLCEFLTERSMTALQNSSSDLMDTDYDASFFRGTTPYQYLLDQCLTSVKYMPESNKTHVTGITFDRRYRVVTPGEYKHVSGKSMNINVGANITIGSYNDIGSATSIGTNGALLGLAAGLVVGSKPQSKVNLLTGAITSASNAPHPLARLLKGALLVGGGVMIANSSSTDAAGINKSFSTDVSEAVFLVVQKAEMEFNILEHEKCLITQFTNKLVAGLDLKMLGIRSDVKKTNPDLNRILNRGLVLCGGKVIKKPEKVIENYYYVTQHFTAGDMLDEANLLNHVWLLALRGTHDYNKFLRILKAQEGNRTGDVEATSESLYEYPYDHLNNVYEKVTPSFPGMYSVPTVINP